VKPIAQTDKTEGKPEGAATPEDKATPEGGAESLQESGAPSKVASPSGQKLFTIEPQLRSKSDIFGDEEPTNTNAMAFSGKPQDENRTARLNASDSFTFLQIPEQFAKAHPREISLVLANEAGDKHRVEARVPSGGIVGDVALATFCVVPNPDDAVVLECTINLPHAEHNPSVYNWMVIEVADEHKNLWQYYLGPQRQKEKETLGYSQKGPLKVKAISFAYPWPDMLNLLVEGKDQQPLLPSSPAKKYDFEGPTNPVCLTIKVNEKRDQGKTTEFELVFDLSTLGQINTVARDAASDWAEYENEREKAKKVLDNNANPKPSRKDMEAAKKFLDSPQPEKVMKARQTIEAFFGAAETVLKKHGRIRIIDPWKVPVIEVELHFQRCEPDDLFKYFAPKDNH